MIADLQEHDFKEGVDVDLFDEEEAGEQSPDLLDSEVPGLPI